MDLDGEISAWQLWKKLYNKELKSVSRHWESERTLKESDVTVTRQSPTLA